MQPIVPTPIPWRNIRNCLKANSSSAWLSRVIYPTWWNVNILNVKPETVTTWSIAGHNSVRLEEIYQKAFIFCFHTEFFTYITLPKTRNWFDSVSSWGKSGFWALKILVSSKVNDSVLNIDSFPHFGIFSGHYQILCKTPLSSFYFICDDIEWGNWCSNTKHNSGIEIGEWNCPKHLC